MGPARMRESLTTTPGIRERPRPVGDIETYQVLSANCTAVEIDSSAILFPGTIKPVTGSSPTAIRIKSQPRGDRELIEKQLILVKSHAFFRKLLLCFFVLRELLEAHATEDIWRLSELNIVVAHDLDTIAPRVAEIEKAAI
jgi:hypothetical protein